MPGRSVCIDLLAQLMGIQGCEEMPYRFRDLSEWLSELKETHLAGPGCSGGIQKEGLYQDLKHLLDAVDETTLISIVGPDGRILYVNDLFCQVFGFTREELVGSEYGMIKSNMHSQAFYDEMWSTIQKGRAWFGEIMNAHKDGSKYWLQTAIYPVLHEDGTVKHYIAIRKDITEGKRVEEQERQRIERSYESVLNNLDHLVMRIETDASGRYIVTMIGGNMLQKLNLTGNVQEGTPVEDALKLTDGEKQQFIRQLDIVFTGQTAGFELNYINWYLYVNLAPIKEGGDVRAVTASVSDITALKRTELAMRDMAFQDPLTGLPNRRRFELDVLNLISERRGTGQGFGMLLVDLDRFKNINDSLGHATGDRFLVIATERMKLESVDESFRYELYHLGGDEFIYLITDYLPGTVQAFIRQVIRVFQQPFPYYDGEVDLQASIGGTFFPEYADSGEQMMKQVDMAMLAAKKSGGQSYRFFTDDMQKEFDHYVHIERELRKALNGCEDFELYYQPLFRAGETSPSSAEALIRWHHPARGLISPGSFIPVAEKSGLIVPLGQWILKRAAMDVKRWSDYSGEKRQISVNISSQQLQMPNFSSQLEEVMQTEGILPEQIQLEITENILMEKRKENVVKLVGLQKQGYTIAIDDFGTGYSSLSYLKSFPVNVLKVDQSFVKDLPNDEADKAIVKATVQMGINLGLHMIAEGVESAEAAAYLEEIGCHELQGFYFAKPAPFDEFIRLTETSV